MTLRRAAPAGLLDAGSAALGTFVVGLYAVRVLDASTLGGYALLFSAYAALTEVSSRIVFFPAELSASKRPPALRLGGMGRAMREGGLVAVAAGLLVFGVLLVMPREVDAESIIGLTGTCVAATILSPMQDHVRKMLHIGGQSWNASLVSAVQLVAVASAIAALTVLAVPVAWRPFGGLAMANFVSGAVGAALWYRNRPDVRLDEPGLRSSLRTGGWLLVGGVAPNVGGFVAAALVAQLAGPRVLGYAEAARVLGRPIAVVSQGLGAVLGPRLVRAGGARDHRAGRRLSRQYALGVGGIGIVYLAVAGFPTPVNPFVQVVPSAYVVPGLTATFIAVYIVDRVAGAGATLQLLGAGRMRGVAIGELLGATGRAATGVASPITGPFAVPLGYLVMSLIRRTWIRWMIRRLYNGSKLADPNSG